MDLTKVFISVATDLMNTEKENQFKKMKNFLYLICLIVVSIRIWVCFVMPETYSYNGVIDFFVNNKGYIILFTFPILFICIYLLEIRLLPFYIINLVTPIKVKNKYFEKFKSKMDAHSMVEFNNAKKHFNENFDNKSNFYAAVSFLPIILTMLFVAIFFNVFVAIPITIIWMLFLLFMPICKGLF